MLVNNVYTYSQSDSSKLPRVCTAVIVCYLALRAMLANNSAFELGIRQSRIVNAFVVPGLDASISSVSISATVAKVQLDVKIRSAEKHLPS
jgi:hypothetical protein